MKKWIMHVRRMWGRSYWKRVMTFLIINAVLWIWTSYYLAVRGMTQIASSLSETALRTIIATVGSYAVKSTVENVSKNGFVGKKTESSENASNETEDVPEEKPVGFSEPYHEI